MKNTIYTISLALALSLCGCTVSEKKQIDNLGKDASSSLKTFGKDAGKVGQAITSSAKGQDKDNSKGKETSKPSNDFEKDASKAITSFGKESDKAVHSIANAVKGLDKNKTAANKTEKRHE